MSGPLAGPVLAVQIDAGTTGFFVVVLLCIAAAGLFVLMSRSLKRLKSNVANGEFHGTDSPEKVRAGDAAVPAQDDRPAN